MFYRLISILALMLLNSGAYATPQGVDIPSGALEFEDPLPRIVDMGGEEVVCRLSHRVAAKKLTLYWKFFVPQHQDSFHNTQVIPLSYVPTAASGFGPNRVVVAGLTDFGEVILEVLEFHPVSAPDYVAIDSNGSPVYPKINGSLKRRRVVSKTAYNGDNWIIGLWPNLGDLDQFWFYASTPQGQPRSIQSFSLSSGDTEIIAVDGAAGVDANGIAHIPNLDDGLGWGWSGEYESGEYVHWIASYSHSIPTIKLVDDNQDGAIDRVLVYNLGDSPGPYATIYKYKER